MTASRKLPPHALSDLLCSRRCEIGFVCVRDETLRERVTLDVKKREKKRINAVSV